jgi:hypothetical protein
MSLSYRYVRSIQKKIGLRKSTDGESFSMYLPISLTKAPYFGLQFDTHLQSAINSEFSYHIWHKLSETVI